ncbi:MAG: sigma factor-like helix-turn-helix DNA-binding protein [Nannocystaceae bacterium]
MTDAAPLSALLLARVDAAQAAVLDEGPALEEVLAALWSRGRSSWPYLTIGAETFFAQVARRFAPGPSEALLELRAGDLYVLSAYLAGAPGARAAFENEHFARVARALERFDASPEEIARVQRSLPTHLQCDRRTTPMRSHYAGVGSLGSWLCISAVRELWLSRNGAPLADAAADDPHAPAYLNALYHGELRDAFDGALAELSQRERDVLRLNVVDDRDVADIGALYDVHRATIARWIARARERLTTRTLDAMTRRLRIAERDHESVLQLIESQLDVNLRRRLGAPPA